MAIKVNNNHYLTFEERAKKINETDKFNQYNDEYQTRDNGKLSYEDIFSGKNINENKVVVYDEYVKRSSSNVGFENEGMSDMVENYFQYLHVLKNLEYHRNKISDNVFEELERLRKNDGLSKIEEILVEKHHIIGDSLKSIANEYGYSYPYVRKANSELIGKITKKLINDEQSSIIQK